MKRLIAAFRPAAARQPWREIVRASVGVMLGVASVMSVVWLMDMWYPNWLFLFAALGASAILVFVIPNSPLAQPLPAIAGNMLAVAWGTLVLHWVPAPFAACVAVFGAVFLMLACKILHPPGGAIAFLTVIHPDLMHAEHMFAFIPVGMLTLVLVVVGTIYNRLTGRTYPFRQMADQTSTVRQAGRLALTDNELEGLLKNFNQSFNLGAADLANILSAAEEMAIRKRFGAIACGEVMTTKLLQCQPNTAMPSLAETFYENRIKGMPVVNGEGELMGVVDRADVFAWLWERESQGFWRTLIPQSLRRNKEGTADQIMKMPEITVTDQTPLGSLLAQLAKHTVQFIPVLHERQLVGIITRTDVIRALLRANT